MYSVHYCYKVLIDLILTGYRLERMSLGKKRSYGALLTDVEMKEKGNRFFAARKYEEAWQCYTNAIAKNPSNPQYYTNRALTGLRYNQTV